MPEMPKPCKMPKQECCMPEMNYGCEMERHTCECGCGQERMVCRQPDNYGCGCVENMPLGMAYVPMQDWDCVYNGCQGIEAGTIFPELEKPFLGRHLRYTRRSM